MFTVTENDMRSRFIETPSVREFFPQHYHDQLELVCYEAGDAICQQDDQLTLLAVFLEGKLKVVRRLFNGKEHILGIEIKPTVIGEVELMTERRAVSSVIALEDSWVVQLSIKGRAREFLEDTAVLRNIGKSLATSLYEQNIHASTNVSYSVKERLATHILEICQDDDFSLELSTLADSFGTSYRHLLRTIKSLLEDGVLAKKKKRYTICDRAALEALKIHH